MTKGRALARGEKPGTTVRWRYDDSIFEKGAHYSVSTIAARLKEKSYLVRGLTFRFSAPGHDEQVFRSDAGLADYVRDLNAERQAMHPTVISLSGTGAATCRSRWRCSGPTTAEERIYSFCNVVNTVDGGTHVSGLRRALTRALNDDAYENGRLKRDKGESLEANDVFDGLTAAVSVMVVDPQFEGQTKGRLNNSEAQSAVQSFAAAAFGGWLTRQPARGQAILDRLLLTRDIRIAQSKISKKLRNAATSIFSDSNLPGKLADTLDNPNVPIDRARALHRRGRLRRRLGQAGARREHPGHPPDPREDPERPRREGRAGRSRTPRSTPSWSRWAAARTRSARPSSRRSSPTSCATASRVLPATPTPTARTSATS